MRVTAEGIETAPQAQALASFRCDQGQGYFHAYPVPIEDLEVAPPAFLSDRSPDANSEGQPFAAPTPGNSAWAP
ncbi:MAG: hypothetical protein ACLP36_03060 [Acidimicrobiales bacterium]